MARDTVAFASQGTPNAAACTPELLLRMGADQGVPGIVDANPPPPCATIGWPDDHPAGLTAPFTVVQAAPLPVRGRNIASLRKGEWGWYVQRAP
eukprot:CAMPEP_0174376900 /NCGR_PEP_ID=MMETSP0811_2-20130205/120002_1 /TAXON_ID=73025 ORGANISM="Eutreptiella gymnastica-like, Strain CCMP1594" /NCGR_SAMPLE_ID=MMETSP0811_2 /ASSEMBLY_ACC=CAM_ASM_000667 /LENGTH=93 /DNA_ID=CAMNT_0015528605 /DNA_START=965 /DNA_END=1245 /DNA_ORIENTATION=+